MRITEGDKVFTGEDVLAWEVHSDPGDASYRTLEIEWQEQDERAAPVPLLRR